ncbi:MAG: hypothetical protein AAFP19_05400 [Bacteroidota bacterium]
MAQSLASTQSTTPPLTLEADGHSQSTLPKRLLRKFRRDAARLALRLEAENEDLRYQNIVIPQGNMENIFDILTAIYQTDETAKSIAKCNIHTFPNPSIDHLVLIFDRDAEWAAPLRDGISETNSREINSLLDEYDLIIEKHVQWNDTQDAITIRSKEPLNMAALANEFYNVEGVQSIDLGVPKMGGNDINIQRTASGWEVEYVLRFGSYISGKGKVHFWKYEVSDEGEVKFNTEGGDPVPEYMRCHFGDGKDLVLKG